MLKNENKKLKNENILVKNNQFKFDNYMLKNENLLDNKKAKISEFIELNKALIVDLQSAKNKCIEIEKN